MERGLRGGGDATRSSAVRDGARPRESKRGEEGTGRGREGHLSGAGRTMASERTMPKTRLFLTLTTQHAAQHAYIWASDLIVYGRRLSVTLIKYGDAAAAHTQRGHRKVPARPPRRPLPRLPLHLSPCFSRCFSLFTSGILGRPRRFRFIASQSGQ